MYPSEKPLIALVFSLLEHFLYVIISYSLSVVLALNLCPAVLCTLNLKKFLSQNIFVAFFCSLAELHTFVFFERYSPQSVQDLLISEQNKTFLLVLTCGRQSPCSPVCFYLNVMGCFFFPLNSKNCFLTRKV